MAADNDIISRLHQAERVVQEPSPGLVAIREALVTVLVGEPPREGRLRYAELVHRECQTTWGPVRVIRC